MKIKVFLYVATATLCLLAGCSENTNPVETETLIVDTSAEDLVRENCLVLQAAVEEFARSNFGEYPRNVDSDNIFDYFSVKDLLPERKYLWNPYEWWRLEPSVEIASASGEIGYLPLINEDKCVGYRITGFGNDSLIVDISNTHYPEDSAVILGCQLLHEAIQAYIEENKDIYPWSLDWPSNNVGKCLRDYLPDGSLLENAITGENTEPSCETALVPGQIGYKSIEEGGFIVGFVIAGYGYSSLICDVSNIRNQEDAEVIANCHIIRFAAEAFAAENGGVYPASAADMTPGGNRLTDFLSGGMLLVNPYTSRRTEPSVWGGSACNPGESGYQAAVIDGINAGYCITGVGEWLGTTIVTLVYFPGE
ncbi:MAG: hypothetical protein KOO63_12760 [Bacteroidales bacterium]|nr:hypothetical protein [Candidatus Latescibacterota bacterium]